MNYQPQMNADSRGSDENKINNAVNVLFNLFRFAFFRVHPRQKIC